jgi:hypothetical protein
MHFYLIKKCAHMLLDNLNKYGKSIIVKAIPEYRKVLGWVRKANSIQPSASNTFNVMSNETHKATVRPQET